MLSTLDRTLERNPVQILKKKKHKVKINEWRKLYMLTLIKRKWE